MEKNITVVDKSPWWFNGETLIKKREKRRKESKWCRVKTENTCDEYKVVKNQYNELIMKNTTDYYLKKIQEAGSDMNKLYKLFDSLTGNVKKRKLPDGFSDKELADAFCKLFKDKMMNIISDFVDMPLPPVMETNSEIRLMCLKTINKKDLIQVIKKVKKRHCGVSPVPILEVVRTCRERH
ncbi:hypothetical protein Pcinc_027371 [Petrolisthes cinctipes]|uniref:Uncharacterized protein n=1 Tax=Petrolisthes cinctipes TaxID=88211 RepID=A0AAE1F4P1_PETCI|nr:hypothetical protein Pcinc_027371 [Petrolisthes cinctipes]